MRPPFPVPAFGSSTPSVHSSPLPAAKLILLLICLAACADRSARADMVNRWSFNNSAGTAASGTAIVDGLGTANAVVRSGASAQANFTGTAITLPGGAGGTNQTPANISAYVDLPNGIISSKINLTVEIWATSHANRNWQRLFEFGRTNITGNAAAQGAGAQPGEILSTATTSPGTGMDAVDSLRLVLNRNTTANTQRLAGRNDSATELVQDSNLTLATGTQYHFVVTFADGAGSFGSSGGQISWYLDGVLAATRDVNFHLSSIEDVNNWLGRSQVVSDASASSNVSYNEMRLYNHAMSATEVVASRNAGPDPTFAAPVAVADSPSMHLGQKARISVLANDTGTLSGPTVTVLQAPQFGTAAPDATGKILYTHTTGTPASDSFTYQVRGPGGTSSPATVTINFSSSLRVANNSLNVPASPPPLATQLTPVVTGLSSPVGIATPPGETQRVFVVQKGGLIRIIPDITLAVPANPTTFLDLPTLLTSRGETINTLVEQGLLGLAFHPNYATNRYFYVFYSVNKSGSIYERVSRFTTQAGNPNLADTTSELILLEQLDQADNHNGGDLHFGPDGYLYVSVGDEGGQGDFYANGQKITQDFFSGILRIDVNLEGDEITGGNPSDPDDTNVPPNTHAAIPLYGGKAAFEIPADNPFIGATTFNGVALSGTLRTEFWAVGMRNPWRFSFDPQTNELWVGDVGQDSYEEIDVVTAGRNYGWSYREGVHNGSRSGQAPGNFDSLYHTPPIYEYAHPSIPGGDANFKGISVTGGLVYRGARFPTLFGLYIFCDYNSGHIWTLLRNGTNPPTVTRIAGESGVVAFGTDPSNGDVLLVDNGDNRILRLTVGTPAGGFPQTLSETGLFADLTNLAPSPGVLPYSIHLPFWSDYAIKSRWFVIPDGVSTMTWSRDGLWTYPTGEIWVKHFDLETTRGNPATKKRLETRLIVKNAGGAYGVSYRWNDTGTEAALVPDGGDEFDFNVIVSGSPYVQRWRIPSRAECLACHTPQAGHALSFTTRQLNRTDAINGFAGNQIQLLQSAGYFANSPGSPNLLPRHLRPEETAYPIEARVRSYLAVNCAYCHRAGGTATPAAWDGRPELTLDQTGLINGTANNNGGNPANKLVVPGDTLHSVVYNRAAAANGFTRMPPLATSELDQTNIALLADWITQSLPNRVTYEQWRLTHFASSTSPEGERTANPDNDGSSNNDEFIALTDPRHSGSFLRPQISSDAGNVTLTFDAPANRSALVETSLDLTTWTPWDVPGNNGLPLPGGTINITGPKLGPAQYFRLQLSEN